MTRFNTKKAGLAIVVAASIVIPSLLIDTSNDTFCHGKTKDECLATLSKEMGDAVRQVDSCVPNLPIGVLSSYASAVYQFGPEIVCDPVKYESARMLKAGNLKGACLELPKLEVKSLPGTIDLPGMKLRRAREMEICLKALD